MIYDLNETGVTDIVFGIGPLLSKIGTQLPKKTDDSFSVLHKGNKPSDIKDLIEDFLCGELVPKIKNNPRLLSYFCQENKHCMILFTFILDPDNYEVSANVS